MKNIEFEREIKPEEISAVRLACSNRGNHSGFIEFADGSRISFKGNTAKAIIAPLIFAYGSGKPEKSETLKKGEEWRKR